LFFNLFSGIDQLASRNKIELCTQIFQAMLDVGSFCETPESRQWRDRFEELSTPAVCIFLYFIQVSMPLCVYDHIFSSASF